MQDQEKEPYVINLTNPKNERQEAIIFGYNVYGKQEKHFDPVKLRGFIFDSKNDEQLSQIFTAHYKNEFDQDMTYPISIRLYRDMFSVKTAIEVIAPMVLNDDVYFTIMLLPNSNLEIQFLPEKSAEPKIEFKTSPSE